MVNESDYKSQLYIEMYDLAVGANWREMFGLGGVFLVSCFVVKMFKMLVNFGRLYCIIVNVWLYPW